MSAKPRKPDPSRRRSGKFRRGQSGNPAGRPRGIADKRVALRGLLEPHAPALVARLVKLALAKRPNLGALRILIDRLIPPLKAADEPIGELVLGATLADQAGAVLAKVARGELTPDTAATLMGALRAQAGIIEISEMARRLAELEAQVQAWSRDPTSTNSQGKSSVSPPPLRQ